MLPGSASEVDEQSQASATKAEADLCICVTISSVKTPSGLGGRRMANEPTIQLVKAGLMPRMFALIIDWLLASPLALIGFIPLIGQIVSICLLIFYWVWRDVGGASIGKRILGLRVVDHNGLIPPTGLRAKRNLIFAIPPIAELLPFIGVFGFVFAFIVMSVVEAVLIASRGERMGDRDARALVVDVRNSKLPGSYRDALLMAPATVPSTPVTVKTATMLDKDAV